MNRLKKTIEEENAEILEEGKTFLENTLKPTAEASKKKRLKKWIPLASCFVCAVTSIVLCTVFLSLNDKKFHDTYIVKASDLSEINEHLQNTQMIGEYDTINKTYRENDGETAYFTLTKGDMPSQTELYTCSVYVITDREYRKGDPSVYKEADNYLGYMVYYNERITSAELNIYEIGAYMDTGAEQYYFIYERWTVAETNGFFEFLSAVVQNKEN